MFVDELKKELLFRMLSFFLVLQHPKNGESAKHKMQQQKQRRTIHVLMNKHAWQQH
jgi:hypothetical protein